MLDREVVQDFLEAEFKDIEYELPEGVELADLVEAFCLYVEDDLYDWLSDNYKSFFRNDERGLSLELKNTWSLKNSHDDYL